MKLYTIGHSNRSLAEFLELLHTYNIAQLIDIRTIPKSRYVPWSNQDSLSVALKKENILYQHFPALGGMRHPHKDSINQGWENASFRGFADYMQTQEFYAAIQLLNRQIKQHNTVIMCAEAVPWRCHRSLIADAETIHRIKVLHILSKTSLQEHKMTSFAVIDKTKRPFRVYYPGANFSLDL